LESIVALDHYITLGRSGLRVSPFCLGTMTFGEDLGWGSSVEESQRIIDRFIELGGNFFDTANFYTKSHSEKIIGDHVGRHSARRDRLVIATKFSGNLYPGDPNGGGSGRKSIIAACENSLRRLQTDYIDLYWLHNWDVHTPIEETMAALEDLVRAGKVRYLGVSDTPAWKVVEANVTARFRGWSAFIGLQIEYSLLERSVEQELVPMALEFGLGITPWSPLKSGVLSGKYTRQNSGKLKADRGVFADSHLTEKAYAILDELNVIAKAHESTVARVALAWVQAQPGVTSTIIGARRLAQLDDNLKALEVKLSAEELGRLDTLTKPTFGFPQNMQPIFPAIHNGGTSVNGIFGPLSPFGVEKGDKVY
jgi:aryl-alcohol dehydrogenase-like predicted oxidoreductase